MNIINYTLRILTTLCECGVAYSIETANIFIINIILIIQHNISTLDESKVVTHPELLMQLEVSYLTNSNRMTNYILKSTKTFDDKRP
jgi:hypothetical protein